MKTGLKVFGSRYKLVEEHHMISLEAYEGSEWVLRGGLLK